LPGAPSIYAQSPEHGPIRQGELVSRIREVRLILEDQRGETTARIEFREHPLAIVLSQDCDLDQDFRTREGLSQGEKDRTEAKAPSGNNLLTTILFCEVVRADELRDTPDMDSKTWKRVRFNKDERYQYLSAVPAFAERLGEGFPQLTLDFKRYFALPTEQVYWDLQRQAKRRCYLVTPYAEHVSTRFFNYQCRIALPVDHHRLDAA